MADLLAEYISENEESCQQIESAMSSGELVDDVSLLDFLRLVSSSL